MATMTEAAAVVAAHDSIELVPITNSAEIQAQKTPPPGSDAEAAALAQPETDPNARPAAFRSLAHEILFVLTATMSIAMPSFLQGSILIVSPDMRADLGMATSQLTWVVAASSLTSGSFLLFFGKVADLFGRRAILLVSLFLFALLALATGFARDPLALIVLNAVMGLASASVIPSAQGILGSLYERPGRRKNYAFACFSSGNHLGFAVSAVFSGAASRVAGWAASFWLLAIIYAAVAVVACFTVPPDDSEKLPFNVESLRQFDFVGVTLAICGIGLLTAGISVGPDSPQGWSTPYIIAFLALGPLLLVAFVWWETRFSYPLMPMGVWRDKEFSLLLAILLLGFLSFPALFFFGALYLQEVFGYSPLVAAVCLIPAAVSGVVVNALPVSPFPFLLVAVQRSGASYWAFTFPAFVIVVFGTDFEFNVVNMYVVSSLPKSQQSIASSVFQTTIKLATVLGLGICAALFASVSEKPAGGGYYAHDPFEPYAALFWFATAVSFVSLLMVPLLNIKTQGHMKEA
ncbi:hypothetical protein PG991_006306 [Apiospora marii]|uniref:Major facilitator superfamily (MFS) profile domain-containing protein n=1 Tax=Apiospora marii TaxID=335849 RepID=A0ABR1SCY0_9PEZI